MQETTPTEADAGPLVTDADPAPVVPAGDIVDTAAPPKADDDQDPPRRRLASWQLAGLTLLAVGFLVGAFFLGKGGGDDDPPAAAPPAPTPIPEGFTTFTDQVTGASLSYPKDWEVIETDGSVFSLVVSPGAENAVSVKTTQIGYNVAPAELGDAKSVLTDKVLADEGKSAVIEQETLTVNGLSAVYYRYNFTDDATGIEGAHERFFIFHGGYLTQLFFQALPRTDHPALSPVFAQIATTFRAPNPPAEPLPSSATSTPPSSSPPSSAP